MDNDLSDIMREIEALEQDFKNEEKALAQSPVIQELAQLNEELSAPVGHQKTEASSEDQTFDWLQGDNNKAEPLDTSEAEVFEMKAEVTPAPTPVAQSTKVEQPVHAQTEETPASVTPITPAAKTPKQGWTHSSPKMTVNFPEGRPVNVEFCRGGESVNFCWSEEGFRVEVEGGISFTIPVDHAHKKVA